MVRPNLRFLATVVMIVCRVDLLKGACPPANLNDGTMSTYVPINESLYDREFSGLDSGRQPLGFYSAVWSYNQGQPNPCFSISGPGAGNRQLEIKVETIPPARLCVKDQNSEKQCFQGRYADCSDTPGGTVYVEFLCDSQCGESDVSFWYRLVLSPPQAVDWCLHRDSQFPQDLATLPPDATLPAYKTPSPNDGTGKASPTSSSAFILSVLSATAVLMIFAADTC